MTMETTTLWSDRYRDAALLAADQTLGKRVKRDDLVAFCARVLLFHEAVRVLAIRLGLGADLEPCDDPRASWRSILEPTQEPQTYPSARPQIGRQDVFVELAPAGTYQLWIRQPDGSLLKFLQPGDNTALETARRMAAMTEVSPDNGERVPSYDLTWQGDGEPISRFDPLAWKGD